MITALHNTTSIHELKNKMRSVLNKIGDGPIVLMNRSTPEAVIVSPSQWDAAAEQLRNYELLQDALRAEADTDVFTTYEELKRLKAERMQALNVAG